MKFLRVILFLVMLPWAGAHAVADDYLDATLYLWRLVNEARANPLLAATIVGCSEAEARKALGSDAWIMDTGLPPLAWNQQLFDSAIGHNLDMIQKVYYAYDSPDGTTPAQRIAATGYQAMKTGESLGALVFSDYIEPMDAASLIFVNLIKDELNPASTLPKNIFDPNLIQTGISFQGVLMDLGVGLPLNVYLFVGDFAKPFGGASFLLGNVCYDPSGIQVWTPSCGVSGIDVVLKIREEEIHQTSFPLGAYQFNLPAGSFTLEARNDKGEILAKRDLFGMGVNQLIDLWVNVSAPAAP